MTKFDYEQPKDDNFAAWHDHLWKDATSTCSAHPSFKGTHSLRLGEDVFLRMTESRTSSAQKLTNALAGESTIGSYVGSEHVGGIVYIVFAIIAFIVAIVAALALAGSVRQCISRWFCGCCRSRSRIRLKAVKPHNRSFLFIANLLGLLTVIAGFVFIVLTSVQGISGVNRGICGVWLGLYGHYFGLEQVDRQVDRTPEIAWSWSGSHVIMDQLRALDERLEPGQNNPVYTDLLQRYATLQNNANAQADTARGIVQDLIHLTKSWNETWYEWIDIPTDSTSDKLYRWRMLATEASISKGDVYLAELDDTLTEGWDEMERLLDLYSGPESRLMKKASDAVKDTFFTIADVDAVVGALTKLWSHLAGTLSGLMLTLISLIIVVISVALITAAATMYLSVDLVQRLQTDQFPRKPQRRMWATAFGTFAVLAGVAIVLSAISFLVAAVGSDVCVVLQEVVFEQGRWDLLGDSILTPREPMNVDINVVFNTCLRNDGTGDIASALGLDGKIAELAEDTDAALADIIATRELLLQRDEKTVRAQVLVVAYKDLLELQTKNKEFTDVSIPSETHFFNETEFVRFDKDDFETVGRRSVLCVVPKISQGALNAAYDCIGQGVQFNMSPHNKAMDVLIENINLVHALADELGVTLDDRLPRLFCSEHAVRQNHPCKDWAEDEGTYMLSSKIYSDSQYGTILNRKTWGYYINAQLGATALDHAHYLIGDKIQNLMYILGDINDLTSIAIAELPVYECEGDECYSIVNRERSHLVCLDGSQTCTLDEARQVGLEHVYEKAGQIVPETVQLFTLFDEYVDLEVSPIMESLVADANAVTDGSNCQFEGTAFQRGAVDPMCQNMFPAFVLFAILLGVSAVVFLLFAIHTFKWWHYMEDLAALECKDDEEQYDAQKAPAAMTSAMSNLAAIYSSSPRALQPVISNMGAATPTTASPEPLNFQETEIPPPTNRSMLPSARSVAVPSTARSEVSASIMSPLPPSMAPNEVSTPRPVLDPMRRGELMVSGNHYLSEKSQLLMSQMGGTSFDSDQMIPISAATRYR